MTGDQLYDRTKAILQAAATPFHAHLLARVAIRFFLMEEVPQPKVYRWKREVSA